MTPDGLPLPPYDPELVAVEDNQHRPLPKSLEELQELRRTEEDCSQEFLTDPELTVRDHIIPVPGPGPGPDGYGEGTLSAISLSRRKPIDTETARPGILFFHGGGRVMGTVYTGLRSLTTAVKELDAVVLSVNYGLAPETPAPDVLEGCYASLLWLSANLRAFQINPKQFILAGVSAGAGLAAGVALMARDRNGPQLAAQLLMCPMLDDRCDTLSCLQFENGRGFYTAWDRYAWSCVLGSQAGREGGEEVSPYVAPARAKDLSGLPLAYIDAASGEPFRDEDVAYARRLWACGVQAHLHVWGGGVHGFDLFYECDLGRQACETRNRWLVGFLRSRG
ncbi:alpha/beta hydrolase fold-domain-containing protein [Aspergillus carlsbadensis]|nr:alpha/beta hydrolase fold-domain-containing protein [Aspergillus carlsbadensis]